MQNPACYPGYNITTFTSIDNMLEVFIIKFYIHVHTSESALASCKISTKRQFKIRLFSVQYCLGAFMSQFLLSFSLQAGKVPSYELKYSGLLLHKV